MTRIGLLIPYSVGATAHLTTSEMIAQTTENVGNLMFRYAASKLFPEHFPMTFDRTKIEEYRENVDLVVYPTANQLNPKITNLHGHADFFRKLNKPIVMLGLGAQSDNGQSISSQLNKGSIDYFRLVSEMSVSIGVRGQFTAEMLNDIGVKNATIMGCPSNFVNDAPDLGKRLEKRYKAAAEGCARVSFFPQHGNSYMTPKHTESETKLYQWCQEMRGGTYIVNGPSPALCIARGRAWEAGIKDRQNMAAFFAPSETTAVFERSFRAISRVFPAVESLMEHLSQDDLSFGKRVHGAFAATQSGTPAVIVEHDSRTAELARTTRTPAISLEQFSSARSLRDVMDMVSFDGDTYDKNRKRNYSAFLSLFGRSIPPHLQAHVLA